MADPTISRKIDPRWLPPPELAEPLCWDCRAKPGSVPVPRDPVRAAALAERRQLGAA
jgi:hypothetical protein